MSRTILPIISCLFILTALAAGQETLSGVQRDIARVEKEIAREKKLHKLEKEKSKEFEKRKKEKLEALRTQSGNIDKRISEIKSNVGMLKKQKSSLAYQINNLEAKRKGVSDYLLKKIGELKGFFASDFPYQRDKRLTDLQSLEHDVKEGIIEPEEGMNRLFTLLQAAISLGYDSEVYSGSYRSSEGAISDGNYLRLGGVISCYVSLDGKTVGYLIREDSAYTWIDNDLELSVKQNIKQAIKVAEGKAAPELVVLPFGSPVIRQGGE